MIPQKFIRTAKWAFALSLVITVTALAQQFAPELLKQMGNSDEGQTVQIPAVTSNRQLPAPPAPNLVGTNLGVESEPNGTFGTANPLGANPEGKIKGNSLSGVLATAGTDEDWYSFTTTVASSKIYAATVTSFSGGGTDTILTVFDSTGAVVLETDNNDGTFGGSSSSIAGTVLATPGTYYLRVTNVSTTAAITSYDLYFAVRSGAPTAETEPNNNGTPQVLPASQYVSGVVTPATPEDSDTFTFTANAGDTVFISLDLDPERDVTTYNGRIGLGVFGTPGNLLVTGDTGTGDTIDSEAIVMTVETTGTYTVYTDTSVAGSGGPTATYNFNVTTIPALPAGTCTTYTNAVSMPIADVALTSSTLSIPDSKIIRSLRVILDISHIFFPDLDIHLRSPANNDNGLVTDVGASTQTGPQNINLNDDAAIPGLFAALNGPIYQPDAAYRLDWFRGENSLGTWTLDIRDDAAPDGGTLNSWSLEVCEEPPLTGTVVYNQDFEANNGSYTLGPGVTANEWEYGTPATVGTITSPPIAAFSNCASGTGCWKTDLDSTYEISSNQDLTSPAINLAGVTGPINLYWQARYQMESTSFDRIWVRVTEVGNPANTRIVWHSTNATMRDDIGTTSSTILPASAGWGRYSGNISSFAGLNVQVTFHLESDSSINYGGFAIDDVSIRGTVAPTPTPSTTPTPTATASASPTATASATPSATPTATASASASASPTCAPVVVSYTGAPVAIPDSNTTGVNLVVAVAGLSSITDLDLRFDGTISSPDPLSTTVGVNHSWVGDMIFRLTSPGGTTVTLYDRPGVPASTFGCSSNNLFALTLDDEAGSALEGQCPGGTDAGPLTGTFTPNNPLSAFDGQNPNGNWTLTAIDAAGGDTGTVRNFSLIFGGACGTPPPSATATASPSTSASPTATCVPGDIILTGSIAGTEPTHNTVNGGAASSCAVSPACPGKFAGTFHHDVFPLNNPSSSPACITVTLSDATCIYATAYLNSFDPNNACTNYLADSNFGSSFSVTVPGNATIFVVVDEFVENSGCPNYTVTVSGLGGGCPSPTVPPGTPTPSPTCTPSGFVAVAPMPIDLYGGAAASDGTFAYVAGGYSFSASNTLDVFNRYNPVTNTWTPMPAMPAPAANMASGVYSPINNKIYVFGGGDAVSGVTSNVTRIYDLGTNTWTTGAVMPAVRGFMASGYFNGKIYLIAGYSTGNVTPTESQVWEYDPVANTWDTSRLAIPHPIGGAGFGIINGHFYVAGGRDGVDVAYNGLWDYDIAANTWTQRANLLSGDNVPGSAVINGQLWIFGGGNPFLEVPTTTGVTQIYDPGSDSWSNGPSLTAARSFVVGAAIGNTVFAAGGYNGATTVPTAETAAGPCPPGGTPTPSPTASASPTCVPGGGTTVSYTGAPVAVPDSNTTGVNLVVAVAGVGTISDLDFRFDGTVSSPDPLSTTVGVNHSWVGDLIFRLTSPGGTTVTFYDRPGVPASTFGCSSNNLFALTIDDEAGSALEGQCPGDTDAGPLTGTFSGNNLLSAFDGQNADGNWTLTAIDAAGGDVGTVRAFSLIFGGGGCPSPTPPPGTPTPTPSATCPPVITHSSSQAITPLNSVSCNNASGHTDNSYWRAFNMNTFVGGAEYNVSSVSFGVEEATGAGGTQPVTVRLYTNSGAPFPGGTRTQIATTTVQVLDSASGTVLAVPLVASVPAGTSELVMEVFTPNGQATGNFFFIGSNTAAETGPSYLSAADCGIATPTDTATIGFPDMNIVFNVLGTCVIATPTPSPSVSPSPSASVSPTPPPGTPTPSPSSSPSPSASASPSASPSPVSKAINLSTRMRVQTGDRVGIGGFIITGNSPKDVIIRAIGPTLTRNDIVDVLADPVLELHGPSGFTTVINNNWRDTQEDEIEATGIPPTNDLESAIVATLDPGPYTAIVRGNGNTSGVALVEVYDLNQGVDAKLANLSTRAFVSTGDNIVIAGFLLSGDGASGINGIGGPNDDRVIVRGIGPSLAPAIFPAAAVLADPTLELRDANGTLIVSNNDWQDNGVQAAEITAAGLAPSNSLESAIAATLPPGLYTALLAGRNNGTGIGIVEIYDRGPEAPAP